MTAALVDVRGSQAPPEMTFLQDLHFQMPTTWRFMVSLPQNWHV
eukprot:CAMPEP_0170171526 /NCGR_PEP_ID=MMETSP0040_2-20121228/4690_1 /TAXON_ID=641309 /ORGANISM="Lotharella oceanica, Strain CCMP622" /LENGTH=43 /DNA_ID= /DNA_START= /DNA_END= /DNA_ORIENTATION=